MGTAPEGTAKQALQVITCGDRLGLRGIRCRKACTPRGHCDGLTETACVVTRAICTIRITWHGNSFRIPGELAGSSNFLQPPSELQLGFRRLFPTSHPLWGIGVSSPLFKCLSSTYHVESPSRSFVASGSVCTVFRAELTPPSHPITEGEGRLVGAPGAAGRARCWAELLIGPRRHLRDWSTRVLRVVPPLRVHACQVRRWWTTACRGRRSRGRVRRGSAGTGLPGSC